MAVLAPDVGGAVAGVAGGVGDATVVAELVATGLGIAEVEEDPPPPSQDVAASAIGTKHRKATSVLTDTSSGPVRKLWEDTGPMDEDRRAQHPLPVSRRRFLERSAMAVAGGVLFACTGGKVVPHVTDTTPTIETR